LIVARFLPIDRDSEYLFPPSVQDWLPETHLARYIANVIESLDLSGIVRIPLKLDTQSTAKWTVGA